MKELKSSIEYRFEPTDRGGRITIRTKDSRALAAIHQFLRFQIDDHKTGDSKKVVPDSSK